jgi:hypothetical protein
MNTAGPGFYVSLPGVEERAWTSLHEIASVFCKSPLRLVCCQDLHELGLGETNCMLVNSVDVAVKVTSLQPGADSAGALT